MNKSLHQIGIVDDSFELVKVSGLIRRGVIDQPLDGNHGETHPKGEDFVEAGVPFIMASDINNGRVDYSGCKFITAKQADSLRKGFAKSGDVLVTHKASVGRTAIVNYTEHPFVMLTPQVTYYRVLKKDFLDNRYLLHYFDSSLFQQTIKMWAGAGSTRAYLGITAQHNLPIIMPPIDKQRKIAAILSAYDDLIENNKRRIALLEKMAEEIYREWFVRFRFPGYQDAEFEKGIPKGWGLKSVAEAININPAERPHKDDLKPYVGMEALSTSSMYFDVSEFRQGNAGSKFRNGDTLFPRITPCLENGKKGFVMCLDPGQVAIGSTEFIVFREKLLSPEYIYLLSCFEPFRTHAEISMVGASGRQRVAENCFLFFFIAVPPKPVLDLFTDQVRPMFESIKNLNRQNKVLDESKSMLLPRLISGKLSVEDLDIKFPPSMEEVVE